MSLNENSTDLLPLGRIPARISNLKPKKREPKGWREIRMPWGVVYGSVSTGSLKQVAYWSDEFLLMLHKALGSDLPASIGIRVSDPEEYAEHWKKCFEQYETEWGIERSETPKAPPNAFYNNGNQEVACAWDPDDWQTMQRTLAHELTHAYVDLALGVLGPTWFSEGLAEFFAQFSLEGGLPHPGGVRMEGMHGAWDTLERMDLHTLLDLSLNEYYEDWLGHTDPSWAFVRFLVEQEGIGSLIERIRRRHTADLSRYEEAFRKHVSEYISPPQGYDTSGHIFQR